MKTDVYDRITTRICDLLEAGTVPWHKAWFCESSMPRNLISGKKYRGINSFLLGCSDYASPHWLTFKQAKALGGNVRKGEKSTPIIFWQFLEKPDKDTGEPVKIPMLKHYNVFNVDQCELPEGKVPAIPEAPSNEFTPIQLCEQLIDNMPSPPRIVHPGMQPCYQPRVDVVKMPKPELFDGAAEYYSTMFHELTHSTGHESRLKREGITNPARFGSHRYSKEELVAEMGAAFLCGHCGIENATIDNSAAYLRHWLEVLKSDSKMVIQAAGAAQKAADYILGTTFDVADETQPEPKQPETAALMAAGSPS